MGVQFLLKAISSYVLWYYVLLLFLVFINVKLVGIQLRSVEQSYSHIREFPICCENYKFITAFTISCHLTFQNQMNILCVLLPFHIVCVWIAVLFFRLYMALAIVFLQFWLYDWKVCTFISPMCATCPTTLSPFFLVIPMTAKNTDCIVLCYGNFLSFRFPFILPWGVNIIY
jgi:hypothetical protein